jgi:hypothetical protein
MVPYALLTKSIIMKPVMSSLAAEAKCGAAAYVNTPLMQSHYVPHSMTKWDIPNHPPPSKLTTPWPWPTDLPINKSNNNNPNPWTYNSIGFKTM